MKQYEFCYSQIDGVLVAAPVGEIEIITAPELTKRADRRY